MNMTEVMHFEAIAHSLIREFLFRIIVAGTRGFNDYEMFSVEMWRYLEDLKAEKKDIVFISGAAKTGADALIIRFAKEFGFAWSEHVPDWGNIDKEGALVKYNRRGAPYNALAGFDRNQEMSEYGNRLLTFYDGVSSGTRDMITHMRGLGHPVRIITIPSDIIEDA